MTDERIFYVDPKNIKDNSFVSGNPAIDHKKRLKNEVIFRNLSERYKKIKK